jgi:hypothetical protein
LGFYGGREEIALDEVAAKPFDKLKVRRGFYALGDDRKPKAFADAHDMLGEQQVFISKRQSL